MNDLTVFTNEEFGEVRTVTEGDKVYFCGSDVAKALGYKNAPDALNKYCRYIAKYDTPHPQSSDKLISMIFIPEGDVYRLIAHSKLPEAEKFEKWVFDEVLPTILRTGGYVNNEDQFIELYLPFADENTKNLFKTQLTVIREQNEKILKLNGKIEQDKPLVDFANQVADTSDLIDMAALSKLLKDEHIDIGRNRLFQWLRDNKYLRVNNEPYQRYVEQGIFQLREYTFETPYGSKTGRKTYVTGKGQIYITEKLRAEFNK